MLAALFVLGLVGPMLGGSVGAASAVAPPMLLAAWGSRWTAPPGDDGQLSIPGQVAIDSLGTTFVLDSPLADQWHPDLHPRVVVYDAAGSFVRDFGGPDAGAGELDDPRGLALGPEGRVLVTDTGGRILVFAADGSHLATWGGAGTGPGQFGEIGGIAVSPDGQVYVADAGTRRVQVLSADGAYLAEWSVPDRTRAITVGPDGDLFLAGDEGDIRRMSPDGVALAHWRMQRRYVHVEPRPGGIAVGADGRVYVSAYDADEIEVFDGDGRPVATWSTDPERSRQHDLPTGVAVGPDGNVVVALRWVATMAAYSPDGPWLRSWGAPTPAADQIVNVGDLAVGPTGDVYVADAEADRVDRFAADGDPLGTFGGTGRDPGDLRQPGGIDVGPDGLVYVADTLNRRVQVFTPEGGYLRSWSTRLPGARTSGPDHLTVAPNGHVFVLQGYPQHLLEYSAGGRLVAESAVTDGDGSAALVSDLAAGPGGDLYLLSYFGARVLHLGPDRGSRPSITVVPATHGNACCPRSITVDRGGVLSVSLGEEVQRYTAGGQYLGAWSVGTAPDGGDVAALDVDGSGRTVLARSLEPLVAVFAPLPVADARVRVVPGGPWLGDDHVDDVGTAPTVQAVADGTGRATVAVRAQNDGPVAESFVLRAASAGRSSVRYELAGVDVTEAVTGDGVSTPMLEPGRSVRLLATVQFERGAGPTLRASGQVTMRSASDPMVEDVVRFVVRPG